jgi:hypothetical protein
MAKYKNNENFIDFLLKFKEEKSSIGDLANDFLRDEDTEDIKSCGQLQTRIIVRRGCLEARKALIEVFKSFIKSELHKDGL